MAYMEFLFDYLDQARPIVLIAGGAILLFALSAFADRRRQKRKAIEAVGFMPWTAISVFSMMVALIATAISIKTG